MDSKETARPSKLEMIRNSTSKFGSPLEAKIAKSKEQKKQVKNKEARE